MQSIILPAQSWLLNEEASVHSSVILKGGKMANSQLKHGIGTIPNRQTVENALQELKNNGFPMNKISAMAKSSNRDEQLGGNSRRERTITSTEGAASGAVTGGVTGGLLTLIGGLGVLLIPGFGPALAAESILATLLASGLGAGTDGLVGALQGWFIPEDQAKFYNDRVSQGNYLVMIEGTEEELRQAESLLNRYGVQEWRVYNVSLVR